MRVLLVGATGTVGSAIGNALESAGDSVIAAGFSSGDHRVDLREPRAVRALIDAVGPVDAIVCAAGVAQFGSMEDLDDEAYRMSFENKLMGQVHLVRFGLDTVLPGGSFTLTSGTLSVRPTAGAAAVAMVGGGIEAFVRAAALDLQGRYRVNVVSPGWVAESRQEVGLEPMPGIWARDLAEHYVSFVHGDRTGVVEEAEFSP